MTSYALKRGVALLTLVNPPVNGLNQAMREGILQGLAKARADGAKAIVMMGDGRTFPAGADIAEFARGGESPLRSTRQSRRYHRVYRVTAPD